MAIASDKVRRARPLLGTFVEIEAAGAAKSKMDGAIDAAFEAVAQVHRLMSFHDDDSDVSRLNREAWLRPVKVDAWTFRVLEAAVELHRRSKGIFDIAIAATLQNMGLLPRPDGDPPAAVDGRLFDSIELLEDLMVRFGHRDVRIDLGGIAKGFAVDRALEVLRGFGLASGLVNAGGDLAAFGREPQTIHIRHPRDPRRLMCRVEITNEALASTAHRFDLLSSAATTASAIIDPATGVPVQSMWRTATVAAGTCVDANIASTAAIVMGEAAIGWLKIQGLPARLVDVDGRVNRVAGWPE